MCENEEPDGTPILLSPIKFQTKARKPKVVSSWSENDVFKLISCVEEYPALWDARDSQYRNKHQRNKLWNQISEINFNSKFAGAELLAKWSNMRIQFRSYANKKGKSGDATAAVIHWKFFSAMQFIGNAECDQTAVTESNLILPEDTANSSTGSIGSTIPSQNISCEPQRSRKRRLSTSSVASTSSAANVVAESMKSAVEIFTQSKQQNCDEFETFGKYLASELRSLDNIAMARRIKRKISRFFEHAVDEEQESIEQNMLNNILAD